MALRIRMYRTGFGDCFLLSFGDPGGDSSGDTGAGAVRTHVLVDFGVHSKGIIGTMDAIMANIETETGGKLAAVVASHAHQDHISGFGAYHERFAKFSVGEVWLPWLDNPDDPVAAGFGAKHLALCARLDAHLRLPGAAAPGPLADLALNALDNNLGNGPAKRALRTGFGTGATTRYFRAGDIVPAVFGVAGLSAEMLAPSDDTAFLSRMNPPSDQRFLTSPGDTTDVVHPFPALEILVDDADYIDIVAEHQPVLSPTQRASLEQSAEAPAARLALALDSVRNNTSLVILFRYLGKALLFPGDAQWGNWQSWIETPKGKQILGEVDFIKVAHHGSENATPVEAVQALPDGIVAMVSTQVTPFPTIPLLNILTAVGAHCAVQTAVRSDWVTVVGAVAGPPAPAPFPAGFAADQVWIDCNF